MTDRLIALFSSLPDSVVVILLAAVPVAEVRLVIPLFYHQGMSLALLLPLAWLGSLAPVLPVLLLFERAANWLARKPVLGGFVSWLIRKARSKEHFIKRWGMVALVVFVAIPFPGFGTWTGALIAAVLGLRFWPSVLSILIGAALQVAAVTALTLAGAAVPHLL